MSGPVRGTPESLRSRKRRETRQRIAKAGIDLFLKNGFEATTLDAIAEAADISRRTFFHYFDSKEAVLETWERTVEDAFSVAFAGASPAAAPLDAVRDALMMTLSCYASEHAIAIGRLMSSTESLRARKQSNYQRQERALYMALTERWPDPKRRSGLRFVAMMGLGALRLAAETWTEENGRRPLEHHLKEAFAELRSELGV